MMEAVRTSETSVDNLFTRQYNPEDSSERFIETKVPPGTPDAVMAQTGTGKKKRRK
jgi:hypothetical protein